MRKNNSISLIMFKKIKWASVVSFIIGLALLVSALYHMLLEPQLPAWLNFLQAITGLVMVGVGDRLAK
uniref:hypothetical protein n=2 Tax=Serratia TaxID=613 RepID=UPI001F4C27C4|nr:MULTISPECIES: hypothetical protein [Serratia]ULG12106.1 hypothetical protein D1p1_00074 [Serratia entomophila]ULG12380.1 hypothetical protein M3p_00084 [Serratia entomophila]